MIAALPENERDLVLPRLWDCHGCRHVQAASVPTHRLSVSAAREAQIRTSNIAHSPTLGTILIYRLEVEWINSGVWAIAWIRLNISLWVSLPADYHDYFIRNLHDALSDHTSRDVEEAVVAHMMPNLPNLDMERDMESFREFFENPSFRADGLKIYPTLVIQGTGLYELWKTGRYKNYPPEQLVNLVARVLSLVPPWTRVYHIQHDIPMPLVRSGVEKGNLRELALMRMEDLGLKCKDDINNQIKPEEVELVRRDYCANKGWETFLAYEDTRQDILEGLLRMRKCGPNATCPELLGRCSIVRELHVYGTVGYGTLLMEEAERIARKEHRSVKLAVISGVGTRHYYRKLGYELEGPYMTKRL
ncbi:hypothetical protein SELMODRAFT_412723 [Selaginella moellendorffii]|uniref:N-acetyltransferase domain-containing protein n=1 Tax=Selaginella moellendorffii TaxID=88036 RepID=D8RL98_SELML|nr:hypothetical protein SELMODRAFT_412723 [Selaginella moellendorffii]